jgi:exodeoxyribonuclease VII large subunit
MSESKQHNVPEFSFGEVSRSIKRLIEDSFGYVKIRGEVSGFKQAASGHCYFSLKDDEALISAVCFRNAFSQIDFKIEDGLEICVYGKVTTYEGRSNYQVIVQKAEIAGIGSLMDLIEKRRKKLLAEGLFNKEHKKNLPFWPGIIGVITSKTGAVIEDIIHRVEDRFPTNIHLYPSLVQGKTASAEIIRGIKYFNSLIDNAPDVIIIARGGGSFEDLLAFNDEDLVRAVFESKIPIVSAVGHETDTTLVDYVSDVRAPTPSAAAEIITPNLTDLKNIVVSLGSRLDSYVSNNLDRKKRDLDSVFKNLTHPKKLLEQNEEKLLQLGFRTKLLIDTYLSSKEQNVKILASNLKRPDQILENYENKIMFLLNNLSNNFNSRVVDLEGKITLASKLLDSYHYKKVLKRGYAIIRSDKEGVIGDIGKITNNQKINIEMDGGNIDAVTT